MKVSDFDFDLPEECIALRPVSPKDSAKLLQVSSKGELLDYCVKDLPNLLVRGDVLVINETRVLHAALLMELEKHVSMVEGGMLTLILIFMHQCLIMNGVHSFVQLKG